MKTKKANLIVFEVHRSPRLNFADSALIRNRTMAYRTSFFLLAITFVLVFIITLTVICCCKLIMKCAKKNYDEEEDENPKTNTTSEDEVSKSAERSHSSEKWKVDAEGLIIDIPEYTKEIGTYSVYKRNIDDQEQCDDKGPAVQDEKNHDRKDVPGDYQTVQNGCTRFGNNGSMDTRF